MKANLKSKTDYSSYIKTEKNRTVGGASEVFPEVLKTRKQDKEKLNLNNPHPHESHISGASEK